MELNTVIKTGTWSDAADRINSNFSKTSVEVERIKLSSTRNKGLYPTVEALKASIPSPVVGDWAIVGNTVPGPVYQCKTKGIWSNTGQTGGAGEVNLNDYYTKEEIDPKLSELDYNEVININALQNDIKPYTLEQAITLVPERKRRLGTKIRFRNSMEPRDFTEATYMAADINTNNWTNLDYWKTEEKVIDNILLNVSIYNINSLTKSPTSNFTLQTAREYIPVGQRYWGCHIYYRVSNTNFEQAVYVKAALDDESWGKDENWIIFNVKDIIRNEVININALQNNTNAYTLEQAIALVPDNQRYLGTKIRFRSSVSPQKYSEATYIAADVSVENWNSKKYWFIIEFGVIEKTRWCALGDSITQGFYSKNGELIGVTAFNYPYYVSIINNYDVTNYGVGGSGYVHSATVGDGLSAKGKVDTINFAEYDLVTLAWGVNDWHYNCEIGDMSSSKKGDETMVGNMMYVIEKILTDNPKCKIIVILPQNSSAFGGNIDTNWGLGARLEISGTLQEVIDRQINVCEYYGIQYIDQTKQGIVNRFNINTLLPDGLHPTEEGYVSMAKYISKQLQYS